MTPRTFTPEEANALLPTVRPLAERMVELRREQREAETAREALLGRIAGNGGDLTRADLADAVDALERATAGLARCVEELVALGVQVKDLDRGLVDFPSVRDGDDVLLCWMVGEDAVRFWHGPADGFAGRKPL